MLQPPKPHPGTSAAFVQGLQKRALATRRRKRLTENASFTKIPCSGELHNQPLPCVGPPLGTRAVDRASWFICPVALDFQDA